MNRPMPESVSPGTASAVPLAAIRASHARQKTSWRSSRLVSSSAQLRDRR